MSFTIERESTGEEKTVLVLTLDTPNSPVNIFDATAASQVVEAMESVDPETTAAVLFRSAKPTSFINGVGLLLAKAVRTPQDALRLTESTRRAYESVRDAKVPTIAAIEGNCYGCGVEFVLNCDLRIAEDSFDTHFYMTEMNDYLFIPAFGGTQNLPGVIGLRKSIDLLLWGERWSAKDAERHGLIHEVVPAGTMDARVRNFLSSTEYRRLPRRRAPRPLAAAAERRLLEKTEARIAAMPPRYHHVYRDCLGLLANASRKQKHPPGDYLRELKYSARSVMAPQSKAALSFFFIRQSAQGICFREEKGPAVPYRMLFPGDATELLPLRLQLDGRHLDGVSVESLPERYFTEAGDDAANTFTFVTPKVRPKALPVGTHAETITTRLWLDDRSPTWESRLLLYSPTQGDRRLLEVAVDGVPPESARHLFRFLSRAGFPFVYSNPSGGAFALNQWLAAFLAPLVVYQIDGGTAGDADATLRELGFVRRVRELLAGIHPRNRLARLIAAYLPSRPAVIQVSAALGRLEAGSWEEGKADRRLAAAVELSLLGAARHCLSTKTLAHPALVDLTARELLDFPLQKRSLCSHLSRATAAKLLRVKGAASWVRGDSIIAAEAYARGTSDFYLG